MHGEINLVVTELDFAIGSLRQQVKGQDKLHTANISQPLKLYNHEPNERAHLAPFPLTHRGLSQIQMAWA